MMNDQAIYNEIYSEIYNKFASSISLDNQDLKEKILFNFKIWFDKKYKDKLLIDIKNENYVGIDYIMEKIEKISKYSNLDKVKSITIDNNFEEFKKISDVIYKLAVSNNRINLKVYNEYKNRIMSYEKKVNEVFKEDYNYLKSECLLDLDYLLKGNNTEIYSLRLGKYISNG